MLQEVRDVTMDLFLGYHGHHFEFSPADIRDGAETIRAELVEITGGRRPPGDDRRQPFSLIFRHVAGPGMKPVLQNMAHRDFHVQNLFLSRVQYSFEPGDTNAYYEVVFN